MACESEQETVTVKYFVDAEIAGINSTQRFGPISKANAEQLLLTLAARTNVNKATLVREVQS